MSEAQTILERLSDLQKNMEVNHGVVSQKLSGIENHLATLNGKVASNVMEINNLKITDAQVLGQVARLLDDESNRRSDRKDEKRQMKEWVIRGIIILLGIIAFFLKPFFL